MIIVFTINKSFLLPFAVTLHSLLLHNKGELKKLIVLTDEIPESDQEKIKEIIGDNDIDFELIQISDDDLSGLVTTLHFQKANYYRLLIPEFVREDKVIYLDADLLILGSLLPIWETPLTNNYLAAVCTPGVSWHPELGVSKEDGYFNSGVMLLNLRKWREENFGRRVIDFVSDNAKLIRYVDQCGLNALAKNNWIRLPLSHNLTVDVYEGDFEFGDCGCSKEDINRAKKSPLIVHFTGTSKPWHTSNQHPFKKKFWKFLRQTPYSRSLPEDFSTLNFIKYLTPKFFRQGIRRFQYRFFPRGKFKLMK